MPYYINYYFKELAYDDTTIIGKFFAPDWDVNCSFSYDRVSEKLHIWNNNKPTNEILPLPIHWLLWKLEKTGKLNENESKISY